MKEIRALLVYSKNFLDYYYYFVGGEPLLQNLQFDGTQHVSVVFKT